MVTIRQGKDNAESVTEGRGEADVQLVAIMIMVVFGDTHGEEMKIMIEQEGNLEATIDDFIRRGEVAVEKNQWR